MDQGGEAACSVLQHLVLLLALEVHFWSFQRVEWCYDVLIVIEEAIFWT